MHSCVNKNYIFKREHFFTPFDVEIFRRVKFKLNWSHQVEKYFESNQNEISLDSQKTSSLDLEGKKIIF